MWHHEASETDKMMLRESFLSSPQNDNGILFVGIHLVLAYLS